MREFLLVIHMFTHISEAHIHMYIGIYFFFNFFRVKKCKGNGKIGYKREEREIIRELKFIFKYKKEKRKYESKN